MANHPGIKQIRFHQDFAQLAQHSSSLAHGHVDGLSQDYNTCHWIGQAFSTNAMLY